MRGRVAFLGAALSAPRLLRILSLVAAAGFGLAPCGVRPCEAQVTPGFIENFDNPPDPAGWTGGPSPTNPGTGGKDGAGDGFLRVATPSLGHLGAHSGLSTSYAGDYLAAGVNQIKLWLSDIETDDPLEIHLSIGNGTHLWTRNAGFLPPHGAWAEYTVDLDGPTGWTRIIGLSGTYQEALQTVDRIHIRHDLAPFVQTPESITGQFGLDGIRLINTNVSVEPRPGAVRPLELRAPYPNPSRGPVTFAMVQHRPSEIRLEIVDVAGRRIRSAVLPEAGAGPRTWMWDGLDQAGNRTPAGAYRVRATGPDGGMSQPLVRIP